MSQNIELLKQNETKKWTQNKRLKLNNKYLLIVQLNNVSSQF